MIPFCSKRLRRGIQTQAADRVLVLDFLAGGPGFGFVLIHKADLLSHRSQNTKSVRLPIFHPKMKGVWHRSLIVKPEKEAVFLDVELSDDILGRKSLEPKGINPGVRSHECYIAGPVACSLFVHQHLLGSAFP